MMTLITDHAFVSKYVEYHSRNCAIATCDESIDLHMYKTPTEYQAHLLDVASDTVKPWSEIKEVAKRTPAPVYASGHGMLNVKLEILAAERHGTVGGSMTVMPLPQSGPGTVPVVYVLFYHKPQEDPSFLGVFSSQELAQAAAPTHGSKEPRIWGPPDGESGGDIWLLFPDGRMPTYYIQRYALNEYQGER